MAEGGGARARADLQTILGTCTWRMEIQDFPWERASNADIQWSGFVDSLNHKIPLSSRLTVNLDQGSCWVWSFLGWLLEETKRKPTTRNCSINSRNHLAMNFSGEVPQKRLDTNPRPPDESL